MLGFSQSVPAAMGMRGLKKTLPAGRAGGFWLMQVGTGLCRRAGGEWARLGELASCAAEGMLMLITRLISAWELG